MRFSKLDWLAVVFLSVLLTAGCEPPSAPEAVGDAPEPEALADAPEPEALADAPAESGDCQLGMGWDPWEPYHFFGAGGLVQGLDIELAEAIAAGAGCELVFVQGDWASLLRLLRAGELDMLAGATRTPEREVFAYFSQPYREESFKLFVRTEDRGRYRNKDLTTLLDGGFRLGVTQGYIYSPAVSELQEVPDFSEQFFEAAVGELNFSHLFDHLIDGFLEDPFVATAIKRRRGNADAVMALDEEISSGPVHLMFSRLTVDAERVEAFDRSLEALRESGGYEEIVNRYLD